MSGRCGRDRDAAPAARSTSAARPRGRRVAEAGPLVLQMDTFRREDLRVLFRQDWYRRDAVVSEIAAGAAAPVLLKRLDEKAVRLVELDVAGRFRGFRALPATERWYPRHG